MLPLLLGAGAGLFGAYTARKGAKEQAQATRDANAAQIEANKVDPRVTNMLFGSGVNDADTGLLGRFKSMLDTPQSAGTQAYGRANEDYLSKFAGGDLEAARGSAMKLLAGDGAPPLIQSGRVAAPGQDQLNLSGAFDRVINGNPAENPYLSNALGGAMTQSRNVFGQMQSDATDNLQRNILPGIRSNAVLSGQYGGSRQGIAEGVAMGDFAKAQQAAINQFGQNNTNQAVGAQAAEFSRGQDRSLAAMQGLSAQQYGKASQDASMFQQTNLANQNAILNNNALNSNNRQAGLAGIGGLLSQASGAAGNQDQYELNKTINVNQGLLQPYLNKNAVPTQLTPVYNNSGASALGGAMAGLGIYNEFKKASAPPRVGGTASGG